VLPGARETSVHMALFPDAAMLEALANPALMEDWHKLRLLRDQANVEIERQRKEKVVGTSLGARLTIEASGDDLARLRRYEVDLPTLFIVSEVVLREGGGEGPPRFAAERATGVKCDRCWRYVPSVSSESGREGLCDRCVNALGAPIAS
jgi:isoleucyl-tRNA synthetase